MPQILVLGGPTSLWPLSLLRLLLGSAPLTSILPCALSCHVAGVAPTLLRPQLWARGTAWGRDLGWVLEWNRAQTVVAGPKTGKSKAICISRKSHLWFTRRSRCWPGALRLDKGLAFAKWLVMELPTCHVWRCEMQVVIPSPPQPSEAAQWRMQTGLRGSGCTLTCFDI